MSSALEAARQLALAIAPADALPTLRHKIGTVTSVTAGAAADGNAAVTVTIEGNAVPAPYLASYTTPTVNDVVSVLLVDNSPLILGKRIGLPVV